MGWPTRCLHSSSHPPALIGALAAGYAGARPSPRTESSRGHPRSRRRRPETCRRVRLACQRCRHGSGCRSTLPCVSWLGTAAHRLQDYAYITQHALATPPRVGDFRRDVPPGASCCGRVRGRRHLSLGHVLSRPPWADRYARDAAVRPTSAGALSSSHHARVVRAVGPRRRTSTRTRGSSCSPNITRSRFERLWSPRTYLSLTLSTIVVALASVVLIPEVWSLKYGNWPHQRPI